MASNGNAAAAHAVRATKVYGEGDAEVRAIDEIDVEFPSGVFTAIMGPSGSGKSTLMHCMAGLDSLTSGHAYLGDIDLSELGEKRRTRVRRDYVGFIFQSFNLVPTLTAEENVTLPFQIAGKKVDRDWFGTVVGALGIEDRLTHKPTELSGGQQQRVAAARALVSRPRIVFADEPTGALDSKSGADLLAFMRRAVDEFGQTMVMVTHDPSAAAHSDNVLFLADGKIVDAMPDPSADAVLDRMKTLA